MSPYTYNFQTHPFKEDQKVKYPKSGKIRGARYLTSHKFPFSKLSESISKIQSPEALGIPIGECPHMTSREPVLKSIRDHMEH